MITTNIPTKMQVTVDAVIFSKINNVPHILLIQRKNDPFKNHWALPGGFVEENEDLEATAMRELAEETGIHVAHLEQLYTFGDPQRDPRGRTITIAYTTILDKTPTLHANDDAAAAAWFKLAALPALAFDHNKIIAMALAKHKHHIC